MSMPRKLIRTGGILLLLLLAFAGGWLVATLGIGRAMDPATLPEHERKFAERMQNVRLTGVYSIDGRENQPPRPDQYDISSVEKIGDDRWRFNARIQGSNVSIPVAVTMRWVDDTPMIMLTDTAVPPLGVFSVRLFFYGDRYSGTWQHGEAGGQMHGRIESLPPAPAEP
jgi:hypothetical protein